VLHRRSGRDYGAQPLSLAEVGQLLWAAQGITDERTGFRAAPSAGALFPLEVFVAAGNVDGLAPGVYRYRPATHDLLRVVEGDRRNELHDAALRQPPVRNAAAVLAFAAVYARTTGKYGDRGVRYVHMEAGHAAQNVYLQAVSLDLRTVAVGAFVDDAVKAILRLAADEQPVYLMPVGKP
jgi:SagB-type dehydrogenase family enzyme